MGEYISITGLKWDTSIYPCSLNVSLDMVRRTCGGKGMSELFASCT